MFCRLSVTPSRRRTSFGLDVCVLDHLAPLLSFVGDELAEPGGRHRQQAELHGYSIGQCIDEDHDGKYDVLAVETRDLKGPRTFDSAGAPLHKDNQTIIKERIYLDRADRDILHDDITTMDHALTRPWTVQRKYHREGQPFCSEYVCEEGNQQIILGAEKRGRLSDAHQEGPAAAGHAVFQLVAKVMRALAGKARLQRKRRRSCRWPSPSKEDLQ
jgi:hypothetical protein